MIDPNDPSYSRRPKKITKTNCVGCEDDFYNGKNPFDIKECHHFEKAVLVKRKKVSVDLRPPWTMAPIYVPSCYHVKRFVFIDPTKER